MINKGRDLIFGTGTPWELEIKTFQSRHQVATPTYQNLILTISQRLLKLEI